jgi:hypothetical protein
MQMAFDARLPGWRGPAYPTLIGEVANACVGRSKTGVTTGLLERAARSCAGFSTIRWSVTTGDNYRWFAMVVFDTTDGKVAIAIPWARDRNFGDNIPLDRSPGAYLSGLATVQDAGQVSARLAQAISSAQG